MLLLANTAATGVEDKELENIRKFLDGLNTVSKEKKKDVELIQDSVQESMIDQENLELDYSDEWKDARSILSDITNLNILRSEVDDQGRVLIIVHHSSFGGLGIFLPKNAPEVSANQNVILEGMKIKIAKPPEQLMNNHNIKGIIALENPEKLEIVMESVDLE